MAGLQGGVRTDGAEPTVNQRGSGRIKPRTMRALDSSEKQSQRYLLGPALGLGFLRGPPVAPLD